MAMIRERKRWERVSLKNKHLDKGLHLCRRVHTSMYDR